jgi:hypothetical protein
MPLFIYISKSKFNPKLLLMNQTKILLILCLFFAMHGKAQECTVVQESLKGKYEGECVKGKADGKGKAVGSDSYDGYFKNGLPDGIGTYVWKNESYYVGSWKKGLRDGKGTMYYPTNDPQKDSIVEGFWKKDKYIGFYEKAFEVKSMTGKVNRVNVRLSDKKGDNIFITISKIGDAIISVSDIVPLNGEFYRHNTQIMTNMSVTKIQQVTFPFRAIFTFNNGENMEIIFNEKGNYDVEVQVM